MSDSRSSSALIWVLVGCGALLVVGICGLTGLALWFTLSARDGAVLAGPEEAPGQAPGDEPAIPVPSAPAPDQEPTDRCTVTAEVSSVDGSRPVEPGATCDFLVERHPRSDGTYWCRSQVVCGGRHLYGGPGAGYYPCTFVAGSGRTVVVGGEGDTTTGDGDAAFQIDTARGEIVVRDDSSGNYGEFSLRARITTVR